MHTLSLTHKHAHTHPHTTSEWPTQYYTERVCKRSLIWFRRATHSCLTRTHPHAHNHTHTHALALSPHTRPDATFEWPTQSYTEYVPTILTLLGVQHTLSVSHTHARTHTHTHSLSLPLSHTHTRPDAMSEWPTQYHTERVSTK